MCCCLATLTSCSFVCRLLYIAVDVELKTPTDERIRCQCCQTTTHQLWQKTTMTTMMTMITPFQLSVIYSTCLMTMNMLYYMFIVFVAISIDNSTLYCVNSHLATLSCCGRSSGTDAAGPRFQIFIPVENLLRSRHLISAAWTGWRPAAASVIHA